MVPLFSFSRTQSAGSAPCDQPLMPGLAVGFPSPATDFTESSLDLNAYLIRHRAASYYFSVEGESMSGAGILDGDKVLVDRAVEPQHSHIVVAVLNSEYMLRRLHQLSGMVELHAENPTYPPIRLKEGEELQIWGVVIGVIRKISV